MRYVAAILALAVMLGSAPLVAQAQSWRPPADEQRCPSKWGAGDQRGSANHAKPENVLRAARLIRTGEVIELAHVLAPDMPLSGTRQYNIHTKRTFMNPQSNRRGSNAELATSEDRHVGTPLDRFGPQANRGRP